MSQSESENSANLSDLLSKITGKFRAKMSGAALPKPSGDTPCDDPSKEAVRLYKKDVAEGKFNPKVHPLWEMKLIH